MIGFRWRFHTLRITEYAVYASVMICGNLAIGCKLPDP